MNRTVATLSLGIALAAVGGCSSTVKKPRLLHPGPAQFQRDNAEQYDPYPQNDVGPEIVGGRPRDYAVPRNEVTRAREYSDSTFLRGATQAFPRY